MYDTKIQTPIHSQVLVKAKSRAEAAGFSSVNDVIRIILGQFAEGKISFNVTFHSQPLIPAVSESEQAEILKNLEHIKAKGDNTIAASDTITL